MSYRVKYSCTSAAASSCRSVNDAVLLIANPAQLYTPQLPNGQDTPIQGQPMQIECLIGLERADFKLYTAVISQGPPLYWPGKHIKSYSSDF